MLDEVITICNMTFNKQLFYILEDENNGLSVRERADIILKITKKELPKPIPVSKALGIPNGTKKQAPDSPQPLIKPSDTQLKGLGVEDKLLGRLLTPKETLKLSL